MNIKNNQRTRLSKILLKNALMDLLGEKGSVTKISVRELCERAELNRSTFYAHYSEPKELLEEVENELLDATQDHLKKIGAENDLGAHRYVIRHQDSLIPTLTVQQKEIFEKLKDCEAELHGMNEREAFISGFKLAARIMTEVLYEPSED